MNDCLRTSLVASSLVVLAVGGAAAVDSPMLYALFLLVGIPLLTVCRPMLGVSIVFCSLCLEPMYLFFFAPHVRFPEAVPVISLGPLSLNFNAVCVLSLIALGVVLYLKCQQLERMMRIVYHFIPFSALCLVSFVTSPSPMQSIETFLTIITPVLFAATLIGLSARERVFEGVATASLVAVPLSIVVAVMLLLFTGRPIVSNSGGFVTALVQRYNGASISVHTGMMMLIPVWAVFSKRFCLRRKIAYAITAIAVCCLVLSLSRGPFACLLASLGVASFVKMRESRKHSLIVMIVLVAVAAVAIPKLLVRSTYTYSNTLNLSGRLETWQFFFRLAMERPLTGFGLGSDMAFSAQQLGEVLLVPHNDYLRIFFSLGIPGFVLYFGGFITLWYAAVRRQIQQRGLRGSALSLAVGISFLLMCVSGNPVALYFYAVPAFTFLGLVAYGESESPGVREDAQNDQTPLDRSIVCTRSQQPNGYCGTS